MLQLVTCNQHILAILVLAILVLLAHQSQQTLQLEAIPKWLLSYMSDCCDGNGQPHPFILVNKKDRQIRNSHQCPQDILRLLNF